MTTTMRITTTTTTTGSTQRNTATTTATANETKPRVINLINEQNEEGEGALCQGGSQWERDKR